VCDGVFYSKRKPGRVDRACVQSFINSALELKKCYLSRRLNICFQVEPARPLRQGAQEEGREGGGSRAGDPTAGQGPTLVNVSRLNFSLTCASLSRSLSGILRDNGTRNFISGLGREKWLKVKLDIHKLV